MPFDPLSGLSVLGVAKAAVIPLKLACAGGASSGTHAVPVVAAATHLLEPSSLAVKASAMLGSKTGAAAATGTVAPQGQSIIDSGQDHPFWWRVTHEGHGLTNEQLQHPEVMGITAEDVPVSAVPDPYAMSTKATGSLLGPWHHNDIPQHSIKPSTDMNQVIQQANEVDYGHLTQGERLASQLKADLMKNPKFSNPMKMYQDMAAELKAHYPHFGTITTKESSFLLAPATASLLPTYNGRVPLDFLDTVAADDGEEVTIISSVLQGTAKAISGFCRGYASSWRMTPTPVESPYVMPVDPITGSALAVKALCVLPLKVAAVGGGYHTAATAVVAAAPTPEITSFGAYGPPEITTMQPTVQLNPAGAPLPTVDVPPPPELTFPPDVFTNIEGLVNSITLPDPTTFTAGAPGTYHEFPGPIDISTGHAVPSVDGEIRTAADLGMQDLVDRANALNKQLFGHPNTGVPSQMYKDVYNEIVNRAHALGRYDVFPRIGSAITDAIGSQPELTPVEPSGVNGVFIPVIEAVRATCGDCCRRPVTQGSSSSSSFLDVEDTSCLRRVLAETYTAYAEAWIGISSALHEIMAA